MVCLALLTPTFKGGSLLGFAGQHQHLHRITSTHYRTLLRKIHNPAFV